MAEDILMIKRKVERYKVLLNFTVKSRFENIRQPGDQSNGAIV